jgi:hypothetical protein
MEMDEVLSRKYVGGVLDVVWIPGVDIRESVVDEVLGTKRTTLNGFALDRSRMRLTFP